jgi:hypothetical protein
MLPKEAVPERTWEVTSGVVLPLARTIQLQGTGQMTSFVMYIYANLSIENGQDH